MGLRSIVPIWYIRVMKLGEYLETSGLTATEFASRIGVSHASVVRYRNGTRRPDWPTLEKIVAETDGAVTAEDFFGTAAA